MNSNNFYKLNNGNTVPSIGYGTYLIEKCEHGVAYCIDNALKAGFRHFDGADVYNNEHLIGQVLEQCLTNNGLSRKDIFITSKVPTNKMGYESTINCCLSSLKNMNLDYFDLYLIHTPDRDNEKWNNSVIDTWRALEYLVSQGKVKSIGVSNFSYYHLKFLYPLAKIKPAVNQIEVHPQHQQKKLVEFCQSHDILVEAWGSLNQGRIFNNPVFQEVAKKNNITIAQCAILWSLNKGILPLATSTKKERIFELNQIEKEVLPEEDIKKLDGLDGGEFSHWHQDREPLKMIPLKDIYIYTPAIKKSKYYLFNFLPIIKIKYYDKVKKIYFLGVPLLKIINK